MASTVAPETKFPRLRFDGERLIAFVTRVFEAVQMPANLAERNARILVDADVRAIQAGRIDVAAVPTIEHETAASARVNGHNGFGLANAAWAMDLAIQKAR